jgi:ribosomal protein L22
MSEKNYSPSQNEKKVMKNKIKSVETPIQTPVKKDEEKLKEDKIEGTEEVKTKKTEEGKTEEKKEKKPAQIVKKDFVVVNAKSVPVSTKYAIAICKFIKNKKIKDARKELEEVGKLKKSIPMKGEFGHRRGSGKVASGEGKFPVRSSKYFITLLKSLAGNATNHDILDPIISEAIANRASAPAGRFGRWKRKRTHIMLKAINTPEKKQTKEKKK